ncbi:MAG: rod shape-determining protein MreC [Undibacterium sp.]
MRRESSFFQKNSVRAIIAAALLWGLMIVLPDGVARVFKNILAPIAAPVQGMSAWVAFEVRDFSSLLSSISDLKNENERLESERLTLFQDGARLRELEEENRLLREALQLPVETALDALSAEVISRDMNGVSMSLTLNRGTTDGVETGMPVVVGKGNLVGRVSAVHLTSAEVRLLSHAESTGAARIAGTSVQGVIRGDHGLGLVFDMALSGETLQPGASLVTSGLGDNLPKGLLIGEIREVRPSADRLFQQASVTVPVAFSDIRYASILKSQSP